MFNTGIKFEEMHVNNKYHTVTDYFLITKELLDELCPELYPSAEHGCISVEYPIGLAEARYCDVMISPTKGNMDYNWPTKDDIDYDWTKLTLAYNDIEKLLGIARRSVWMKNKEKENA